MFSFLRRNVKERFTSNASIKPSGNEMVVELPVGLVSETHVSTCTIMIGCKPISMDTNQEEPPMPAPRTTFKGLTVRISSKPDGVVTISTKPSSSRLPFATITDFQRLNNWEFNVVVDVPNQKNPETDVTRLGKEVDDGFASLLKAAEDIKKAFGVIEKYAVKEATLKGLTGQKKLEKQKMVEDGQLNAPQLFQDLRKDPRFLKIQKELEMLEHGHCQSSDVSDKNDPINLRQAAQAKKESE